MRHEFTNFYLTWACLLYMELYLEKHLLPLWTKGILEDCLKTNWKGSCENGGFLEFCFVLSFWTQYFLSEQNNRTSFCFC